MTAVVDHVGWITLNEPARLNPVTPSRIADLVSTCRAMSEDDRIHVVVVTGAGRGFCSGADLQADLSPSTPVGPGSDSLLDTGPGMWMLSAVRQPVIAMLNGPAVGFGAGLALSADLRIAASSAMLRFPFSLLGTVSDTGAATWLLPRLVGWSKAAELLYTGAALSAHDAHRIGLVNEVVSDDLLADRVRSLASELAARPPQALRQLKRLIFGGLDERKAEHVLAQHFAFARRDPGVDIAAYFAKMRGTSRR